VVGGETPSIGAPMVSGATVAGELLRHERGDKVIAFKKRRRKNSRRKRGYRHDFSVVAVTLKKNEGKKPSDTPPPRPKREPKPEAETKPEAKAKSKSKAKPKAKSQDEAAA